MSSVSMSEAEALLSDRTFCECDQPWTVQWPGMYVLELGVLSARWEQTALQVQLLINTLHKARGVRYKFTVFRRGAGRRLERLYQLDVLQSQKILKGSHDYPHEHFGDRRLSGAAEWAEWEYDDVIAHFSEATNIQFSARPENPVLFDPRRRK